MRRIPWTWIKQYWLHIVVGCFCLLTIVVDTQERVLAQLPTSTPNVKTVPSLEDIFTPTSTPTLSPAPIVTATPVLEATAQTEGPGASDDSSQANQSNSGSGQAPAQNTTGQVLTTPSTNGVSGAVDDAATAQEVQQIGVITADSLNVRAEPNTSSAVVDQLARNSQVSLIRQAEDRAWWYICCGDVNNREGWVSVQYLTILPPNASPDSLSASEPAQSTNQTLQVEVVPLQQFVWQGQRLTLQFNVTNPNSESVRQLFIRMDLPAEFQVLTTSISPSGAWEIEEPATGRTAIVLSWPQIAAREQAVATVDLQVTAEAINGTFYDIIAAADIAGETTLVTGVTISMPPSQLPSFQ